ncbi:MAG: NADH-quinone oxidoreductase subunit NuoK [Ignavibacteria bacterium]|nr:NADH-quinone oxidoreductase subunit NuoK [Ignavibacteria bacterium]
MFTDVGLNHYLVVSGILFGLGLFALISRKNAILILMGIELILNACNINLIAFARYKANPIDGQVMAIFVIILAVCEAAIALAIIINIYKNFSTVDVDEVNTLRE